MKAKTRNPHTVTASVRNAETAANRAEKHAGIAETAAEKARLYTAAGREHAERTDNNLADTTLYSDKAREAATRAGQFAYNAFLSADRACTAERHLRRKVKLNSILCVILILLMAIDIILTHC